MVFILIAAALVVLLISLSAIAVIPNELLSQKVPGKGLMKNDAPITDLPAPVLRYLEHMDAKKPFARQFSRLLKRFLPTRGNDAAFYSTLSNWLSHNSHWRYCLFPDAGLAYVYDPVNGSWQLLKVKRNAQLVLLVQNRVAASPPALLPKT